MQQQLNFDNYTFRCSSLGKLVGDGKGKSPKEEYEDCLNSLNSLIEQQKNAKSQGVQYEKRAEKISEQTLLLAELYKNKDNKKQLPLTCISYLIECYVSFKEGIKKDIYGKYIDKGLACEDEAIDLFGELHDRPYNKCKLPRQFGEFIEGENDVLWLEDGNLLIIDIKNSWDRFTFQANINDRKEINKTYKQQAIGYMKLYSDYYKNLGIEIKLISYKLVYSLMNMPQNLVEDECKRILWKFGSGMEDSPEYIDAINAFRKKCNFDHLSLRERFFEIDIEWDSTEYDNLVERIKDCRLWLNDYSKSEYIRISGGNIVEEPLREVALVEHEPLKGIETTITVIEEFSETMFDENFQLQEIVPIPVLDTIEKENPIVIMDAKLNEITEKYETEQSSGGWISELDIARQTIVKMSTVEQIRDFRKTNPLFTKYPELDQITRDRKSELEKPVAAPIPVVTPKPAPKSAKPTPIPVSVKEPEIDETTTKEIERIWTLAKSQNTYEDFIANVSKPNAQFIIKNKDFCIELQKFGIQLKNQVK